MKLKQNFLSKTSRICLMAERLNPIHVQRYLPTNLKLLTIRKYHVIVEYTESLSTPVRGHILLETEKILRQNVDQRIEIFLEPKADLNALRLRLRGVKV